jgi:hypothetical protein
MDEDGLSTGGACLSLDTRLRLDPNGGLYNLDIGVALNQFEHRLAGKFSEHKCTLIGVDTSGAQKVQEEYHKHDFRRKSTIPIATFAREDWNADTKSLAEGR